jgi:hypothetical protein
MHNANECIKIEAMVSWFLLPRKHGKPYKFRERVTAALDGDRLTRGRFLNIMQSIA